MRRYLHCTLNFIVGWTIFWCLGGCNSRPDDVIPNVASLIRGDSVRQVVLLSGVSGFQGINAGSKIVRTRMANSTLLRPGATGIPATPSSYTLNSNYGNIVESIPQNSLMPYKFEWDKTDKKLVMIAIFDDIIRIKNGEIANPERIRWLWTVPENTLDPGTVLYSAGKQVVNYQNGQFVYSPKAPALLDPGMYVWAVWAWDDKAVNIIASSREVPILVVK